MRSSKIKNLFSIILCALCFVSVAVFSIFTGLSLKPKNQVSFNVTSKNYIREYGDCYQIKKGTFNYFEELNYQVKLSNDAFSFVQNVESTTLKPGDTFEKDAVIAKKDGVDVKSSNDGVVINYTDNRLDVYYFNCFEVVVLLDMSEYKSINYERGNFEAEINKSTYNLYFKSVDLTSVAEEGVYKVSFVTNNCFEIVRPSSVSSVSLFVTTFSDVFYLDNADLFIYEGQMRVFHYKNQDGEWKEIVLISVLKINKNWIVETNENLSVGTLLYV